MWMVRGEDLSSVVEGPLQRGFLPAAAMRVRPDLTMEGRAAIEARQVESIR
jgi:hypothetical protein